MKRTPLARRTPLDRGTKPLARTPFSRPEPRQGSGGVVPSPAARKRINPVSDRRKERIPELATVVAEKRRTVRYCEAQVMLKAALSHPDNTEADRKRLVKALQECQPWNPERPHHMLKRSRGSDETLTASANIVMICPFCDLFTESEVKLSTRAGLLIPSSARPRFLGRLVS